jgi:GT2 family glycosyltransferase
MSNPVVEDLFSSPSSGPRRTTVVVPTYRRGEILLATVERLRSLEVPPDEILVVDQTEAHPPMVEEALVQLANAGAIRRLRLDAPSIPRAMNAGLQAARSPVVLFLDDDVEPGSGLLASHAARQGGEFAAVCGQVLQPGEEPDPDATLAPRGKGRLADLDFRFNGTEPAEIHNVMAGNLSVSRAAALAIGGFDEQFAGSAYRFETDFAWRLAAAGHRILFAPEASIRHLRLPTGGTRSQGDHLRRPSPWHSVGAYYFAFRHLRGPELAAYVVRRLFRETVNRYYVRRPWLAPWKFASELRAMGWARRRAKEGPRLIHSEGAR